MRIFAFLSVVAVVWVSLHTTASAYERPYCMEVSQGWGGSIRDCSYETFAQCYASKVDISSTCSQNPRWIGQPERRKKRR